MLALGMFGLWGAYALGSWGWVLVKGRNITLREWVSPLHPIDLASGVKCIKPTNLFPKLNDGEACSQSAKWGSTTSATNAAWNIAEAGSAAEAANQPGGIYPTPSGAPLTSPFIGYGG